VTCVAFAPDGRRLLSGSDDETLRLWDAESGQEVRAFTGHQGRVTSVAFAPDGRRLLSGGDDERCASGMPSQGRQIVLSPATDVK
jgi:WD40 repeat protein